MRQIFVSEYFYSITATAHIVTIYDRDLAELPTPAPETIVLEAPGYTLNYNANISDVITAGIIESSANIMIRNTDHELDQFLKTLSSAAENRFVIEIARDYQVIWRGVLLQDFSSIEDSPVTAVTLQATDGLGLLKTTDMDVSGGNSGILLYNIIEGLKLIGTQEMFADTHDPFIRVRTDWYCYNMQAGKEPLEITKTREDLWYSYDQRLNWEGKPYVDIERVDFYTYIDLVLRHFNAILVNRGKWYITQRDILSDNNTITYHTFTKGFNQTGVSPETEDTYKEIDQSDRYRADGTFNYLPALKAVERTDLIAGNLIPTGTVLGGTTVTAPLTTGTDNYLVINVNIGQKFDVSVFGTDPYKIQVIYSLEVEVDGYYLYFDGATNKHDWTLTPSVVWLPCYMRLMSAVGTSPPWDSVAYVKQIKTEDLPADGEVTITLDFLQFTAEVPVGATSPVPTPVPPGGIPVLQTIPSQDNLELYYVQGGQDIVVNVKFIADNPVDEYSLVHTMEDAKFGSSGQLSKATARIYDGANWQPCVGLYRYWEKGESTTPKDLYLAELLVNETLSQQSEVLLTFSGDVHDRYDFITPLQLLQFDITYEKPVGAPDVVTYRFAANMVTYQPDLEKWSGDWVQIYRQEIRNARNIEGDEMAFPDTTQSLMGLAGKSYQDIVAYIDRVTQYEFYVDPDSGTITTRDSNIFTGTGYTQTTEVEMKQVAPGESHTPEAGNITFFVGDDLSLKGQLPDTTIIDFTSGLTTEAVKALKIAMIGL